MSVKRRERRRHAVPVPRMATVARQRDIRRDVATVRLGERWGSGLVRRRVRRSGSRGRRCQEERCPAVDQNVLGKSYCPWNHEDRDLRARRKSERELRMIVVAGAAGGFERTRLVCCGRALVGCRRRMAMLMAMLVLGVLPSLVMRVTVRQRQPGGGNANERGQHESCETRQR